jgi:exopolyphosphatase/guanosine-5'-triphosphate,3'-diphosphate pyrophosphatase
VLGKAMRFGAMFAVADPQLAGTLKPKLKKRELELALTPLGIGLFGEVAQARFNSLAQALKMIPVVTTAVA